MQATPSIDELIRIDAHKKAASVGGFNYIKKPLLSVYFPRGLIS